MNAWAHGTLPNRGRGVPTAQQGSAGRSTTSLPPGCVGVPRDLSLTSQSTLSTLDRFGPRRITELAVVEGVTQPSMTASVNGLQRAGLVERQGDPTDRRVALVALSANGKAFMRLRRRTGEVELEQLMEKLPPEELAALTAAIPALEHLSELDQCHQDQLDRRLPT